MIEKLLSFLKDAKLILLKGYNLALEMTEENHTIDARGIPTSRCPVCGESVFLIAATFDDESYELATYMLDTACVNCGTLVTAPTPVDMESYDEQQ